MSLFNRLTTLAAPAISSLEEIQVMRTNSKLAKVVEIYLAAGKSCPSIFARIFPSAFAYSAE
jgi:hypothetical protein